MDIVTGLSTLSQALRLAKELREVEQSFDAASYKAKIADLYMALGDVKIALTDAKNELYEKDQKIGDLIRQIDVIKSGEQCPLCGSGKLKVVASKPHPQFDFAGVQERELLCDNGSCLHREKRIHDPAGRIGK
ncbi:hypothetical protein ABFZ85_12975 [Hyphococcus formosus]|uniref:hypothetical protein n=1 Tax=Hyphococcus formosus TaxID=3143534 RepID=UPI00398AD5BF